MKKIGYIVLTLAELVFLAGAAVIQYFTRRKMGMARYVVYKNRGWEREYPMEQLTYAVMILLILFSLLVLILSIKKRAGMPKIYIGMNAGMAALLIVYVSYTCISSAETMRAYYFISAILAVTTFIQIVKTGAGIGGLGRK